MDNTCGIYVRQSKTHDGSVSQELQEKNCRDYAARQGWTVVVCEADIDRSGTTTARRPGLAKIRKAYRDGKFKHLIIDDLSRLSRDEVDSNVLQAEFESIHSIKNGGEVNNRILRAVYNAINAEFIDQVKIRFDDAHMNRLTKGLSPTGAKIYGYDKVEGKHVPNANAAHIKKMYKQYIQGVGARAIACELNSNDVPTPTGKGKWTTSAVFEILDRKFYAGFITWTRPKTGVVEEVVGVHEPLISLAVWHSYLKVRQEKAGKRDRSEITPQFKDLLKCGRCGGSMTAYGEKLMCLNYQTKGASVCEGIFTTSDYVLSAFNIWADELEGFARFTNLLPTKDQNQEELKVEADEAQAYLEHLEGDYEKFVSFAFENDIAQDLMTNTLRKKEANIAEARKAYEDAQARLGALEVTEALPWDIWRRNKLGTGELTDVEESAVYNMYMKQLFEKIVIHPRATESSRDPNRFPESEAEFFFVDGGSFRLTREDLEERLTAQDTQMLYRAIEDEAVTKKALAEALGYRSDGARSYRMKLDRWLANGALVEVPAGRFTKVMVNPERTNHVPEV